VLSTPPLSPKKILTAVARLIEDRGTVLETTEKVTISLGIADTSSVKPAISPAKPSRNSQKDGFFSGLGRFLCLHDTGTVPLSSIFPSGFYIVCG